MCVICVGLWVDVDSHPDVCYMCWIVGSITSWLAASRHGWQRHVMAGSVTSWLAASRHGWQRHVMASTMAGSIVSWLVAPWLAASRHGW